MTCANGWHDILKENFDFSKAQKIHCYVYIYVSSMAIRNCDLTSFLFPPFKLLLELTFRKDMFFLRFPSYLQMLNVYETLSIVYPLFLSFQQAILFK